MKKTDFTGVPIKTRQFAVRLNELGLDRIRIHGLFVLLGLHAGTPRSIDEIEKLFVALDKVVPIDRSKNIDEVVGDFYDGYEREINELCFRSGSNFTFREIKVPSVEKIFSIVYQRDENKLATNVVGINNIADRSNLFDAFINAVGASTAAKGVSLIDAFSCGVFQMQLHAQMDTLGSQQISILLTDFLPPFYSQCLRSLRANDIDFFLELEGGQIPIVPLMGSFDEKFGRQMWAFQSRLFYRNNSPLTEMINVDMPTWHAWSVKNAFEFYQEHGSYMVPFGSSGASLAGLPSWELVTSDINICSDYITKIWGYHLSDLESDIQIFEYKAAMAYVVYASLATEVEQTQHEPGGE